MSGPRTNVSSYLATTAARLREAVSRIPAERAELHAAAIHEYRCADGGFTGRAGGGDLYYTDFAVRVLHALGRLDDAVGAEAYHFARSAEPRSIIDVVDRLSIATLTAQPEPDGDALLRVVEGHRRSDGGYGKTPRGSAGSTYHTFLAAACYDAMGERVPKHRAVGTFLRSRLKDDGGFGETERAPRGSTNPTAAAVATGAILGLRSRSVARRVGRFLSSMQRDSGGWAATAASPCADIMSTYTALTTLAALGRVEDAVASGARAFCDACEHARGGFRAVPFDDVRDVEYTYYGLGVRALLAGLD